MKKVVYSVTKVGRTANIFYTDRERFGAPFFMPNKALTARQTRKDFATMAIAVFFS